MNTKIPVIINNRDLLTWPKAMVKKLKTLDNVGDIIILDNKSTYEPLLEWYATLPCDIKYIDNLGHTAPWGSGLVNEIGSGLYVVTDSDLGIDDVPQDTLIHLKNNILKCSDGKIGLGLDWSLTPLDSPYYNHTQTYEKKRYINSRFEDGIYYGVSLDTTFSMYSKNNYFIGGSATGGSYIAKHYPWYLTNEERNNNYEFMYYIKNASNSSSYKTFLNL